MPRRGNDKRKRVVARADRLPSRETMARLLKFCSAKTKAAVLLLASSGIRVGELVRLHIADLDLSQIPAVVRIGTSVEPRRWRISYMTPEAKGALEFYLSERRTRGEDLRSGSPLFAYESGSPMTPQAMLSMIKRAFAEAGLKAPRMRLDSQIFRRWFKKRLIGIGAPRRVVDALLGQTRRPRASEEEVRSWYVRAMPILTIALIREPDGV